jgi:uncharacterized protein YciI
MSDKIHKNNTEFIYVLNLAEERLRSPDGWTDRDNELVGIHFKYITELYEKGVVKYVGRTMDERSSFGLVVFDADSEEEAREIMENDPAVANGLMTATLYPFKAIYK